MGRINSSGPGYRGHPGGQVAADRNVFMSVEFVDHRGNGEPSSGIREILRAYVDKAALVANPEFDTTAAEVLWAAGESEASPATFRDDPMVVNDSHVKMRRQLDERPLS